MAGAVHILATTLYIAVTLLSTNALTYKPPPDIGYPAGLIPECPGVTKNSSISSGSMPLLKVTFHHLGSKGQVVRRTMPILHAIKAAASDKSMDFRNRKTIFYAVGYLDSSLLLWNQAIGTAYAQRGYIVFISDTPALLSFFYPKSARLTKAIGKRIGEFLIQLTKLGLTADNLELIGLSLGAHVASFAAKHFYTLTGTKPSRLTGLDPAGPCFRSVSPQFRLDRSDAEKVDVVHTNMDGFGIAESLGHVDFYMNGGEFQPSPIPYIPCLIVCSHVRSSLYFWQALQHPKKFIGMKCDSIQDARLANCYNNTETNYVGFETDFSKPGIFYVGTNNQFPYYGGKEALKSDNEVYTSYIRKVNSESDFVV